jgi:hypothetical protein
MQLEFVQYEKRGRIGRTEPGNVKSSTRGNMYQ